jgi:hypothetical protein
MSHFRIADAEENLGESEVREAHLAKSLFFIRIGDKVWIAIIIYCSFLLCCWNQVNTLPYVSGESLGTSQGNRNQDCCSGAEDGPGVLYIAAWFL